MTGGLRYQALAYRSGLNIGNLYCAAAKMLLKKMLRALGSPPVHVILWNGEEILHQGNAVARVFIHDRGALLKLLSDPELHFGELYSEQRIEVQENLLEFLDAVYRAWPLQNKSGKKPYGLPGFYGARRNTLSEARRNIHHHYDIGNDFYRLWLDENMLYTCAYFPDAGTSLEEAQLAKMDHICRKLCLKPGDKVVEAGCGWGALALHMARHYGVTVKAYNISHEQIAYARQRALEEGLERQVEFIEDDYRNVCGEFDAFVSIGMLEHVGTDHYQGLGAVINRSLTVNGRGLIHSIGLNYPRPMDAWTQRHIFPGACPPSLGQMMQIFEPFDFSVVDVENLRLHYAQTLWHWLQRFEKNGARVAEMFDSAFVRAWRFYLAGSHTAFKVGGMQLFQVLFTRADCRHLPSTREHLYHTPYSAGASLGNV